MTGPSNWDTGKEPAQAFLTPVQQVRLDLALAYIEHKPGNGAADIATAVILIADMVMTGKAPERTQGARAQHPPAGDGHIFTDEAARKLEQTREAIQRMSPFCHKLCDFEVSGRHSPQCEREAPSGQR